jgi:hypothetical protein
MDVTRGVATFNLVVQAVLIVAALGGATLAWRHRFSRHCLLMRTAIAAQILVIGIIMAPQLARYLGHWNGWSTFIVEIIVHHVFGLIVLGLWIYINLAFTGVVKAPRRYTWFMRSALASWLISLGLGIYLYGHIWRGWH